MSHRALYGGFLLLCVVWQHDLYLTATFFKKFVGFFMMGESLISYIICKLIRQKHLFLFRFFLESFSVFRCLLIFNSLLLLRLHTIDRFPCHATAKQAPSLVG